MIKETPFEDRARKFLAMWSFITARVLADLTLRGAPSFGKISFDDCLRTGPALDTNSLVSNVVLGKTFYLPSAS